jgi:hypothetical protein
MPPSPGRVAVGITHGHATGGAGTVRDGRSSSPAPVERLERVTERVGVTDQVAATRSRLAWVDTGRGVAISLVALYHAGNWLGGTDLDVGPWQDVSTVLSSLRMPLFFVLAGLFAPKWLEAGWRWLLRWKVLLFWWVFVVWETIGTFAFPLGLAAADKPIGVTGLI